MDKKTRAGGSREHISPLAFSDRHVYEAISNEEKRQISHLELIASENFTSPAVREAVGSVLTNKYAEGYPGARYYAGCNHVDTVESLARERACKIFKCGYVNVQPHSGSQANQAAFLAILSPGDTILSMDLASGGHLSHGLKANLSGKWFKPVFYGVNRESMRLDMDEVRRLAHKHKPRLIIAGASAYPRTIDFQAFRAIADEVGAFLMADMAHIAGLVAAGLHPSPLPHAHVVTTTTHKTLRGPRGGMILAQEENDLTRKLDSAVFPGIQGGPLMHVIAGKAVCFGEALTPAYKNYIENVIANARALADGLNSSETPVLTGGTDNHMVLLDLRKLDISGAQAETALEDVGMIVNKNTIPFDTRSPRETSGLRLGTAACTTRGLGPEEFRKMGRLITSLLTRPQVDDSLASEVRDIVSKWSTRFPIL